MVISAVPARDWFTVLTKISTQTKSVARPL